MTGLKIICLYNQVLKYLCISECAERRVEKKNAKTHLHIHFIITPQWL
jgi:hypothetical protein